jgi:hypothetical protein
MDPRDLAEQVWDQVAAYNARGEPVPPSLAALGYRLLRQSGEEEKAQEQRALLQRAAADGNERAAEVLEILAEDPWWREGGDAE